MSNLVEWSRRKFKHDLSGISSRVIFSVEALAAIVSFFLAIESLYYIFPHPDVNWTFLPYGMAVYMSWLAISRLTGFANLPRTQRYRTLIFRFLQVSLIEFVICTLLWFAIGYRSIYYIFVPSYCIIRFSMTLFIRITSYKIFKHFRAKGYNSRFVIVIADGFSDAILEKLLKQKEWGFRVKYILSNSKLIRAKFGKKVKIFRENADLRFLLDCDVIDEVIYCKKYISNGHLKATIRTCEEVGVLFRMQSNLSPLEPVRLQLQTVHMKPYFQLVDMPSRRFGILVKNISDIYLSAIALILLFPVFLLIALVIRIDSRGPILYIQERIGLRGRKFKLYKFRTMVRNAESVQHILEKHNEADGPAFKIRYDPRITRVGSILRKTGLDELPQLFNVVRGEMSLIGPRPPVAKEVIQYKRWQLRRLSVKPGITCTWQVLENRNDISFERWMKLDLQYIDNWNLMDDAKLFFRTFNTVIKATGI